MENNTIVKREYPKFSDLVGKTLTDVSIKDDTVVFKVDDDESYGLEHFQDCCESVWIEDVCGETQWLLSSPVLFADESSSEDDSNMEWTFYRIGTFNGTVVIRFCADLDTYYSTSVSFYRR